MLMQCVQILDSKRTISSNFDAITKLTSLPSNFYAVVQELFEVGTVEDTVAAGFE
jgi:hypothetical protein